MTWREPWQRALVCLCLCLRARLLSQFTPSFIAFICFHAFHLHDFDTDLNDAATEEIEFLGSKCRQLEQEKVSVLTCSACFQKCMFIVCIVWMPNSYLFLFCSPSPSPSCVFLLFNTDSAPPPLPPNTHAQISGWTVAQDGRRRRSCANVI